MTTIYKNSNKILKNNTNKTLKIDKELFFQNTEFIKCAEV